MYVVFNHQYFPAMKRFSLLAFMLLAISSLYAQDIYMCNILEVAAPIVEYIEVENSQEIVRMEFDIVSSGPKFTYRDLHSGYTYGICAFGDYRIEDLDIKVYKDVDGEPVLVKKDIDSSDIAMIVVEPSSTGSYIIEISAYKFVEGYSVGHYGLIIFHE